MSVFRAFANPDHVLSYGLAFVVGWFGLNELFAPQEWVTFAPSFLGDGPLVLGLVVVHGVILTTCALLLAANVHRRIAASVLVLVFAEVVVELILQTGLSDIAVRDIGLFALSLGVALRPVRS